MTNEIRDFVQKHLAKVTGRILEVGSMDFNGNVADLVPNSVKTDMAQGPNVDVVCPAEKLVEKFGEESFDTVLSLDAFEHMEDWRGCISGIWGALRYDGYLVMTMASTRKGYHAYPNDYWRADMYDLLKIFPSLQDYEPLGTASIGWVVKKARPLPDLSVIELKKPRR